MRKNFAFSIAGLVTIPVGLYFVFASSDNQIGAVTSKEKELSLEIAKPIEYIATKDEKAAAENEVGEVADELTLITRMIEMSMQKVNIPGENLPAEVASESIHRIQMTKGNIYFLIYKLESIDISRNKNGKGYSYDSILNRWLEGNFEHIGDEAKFLISLISKPYGQYDGEEVTVKSRVEEQYYIQNYFNDKQK
ncbi:lipoprotein [Bacillus freudenreichii]|nr:lipoprotein [Bacillus freudenreichii]